MRHESEVVTVPRSPFKPLCLPGLFLTFLLFACSTRTPSPPPPIPFIAIPSSTATAAPDPTLIPALSPTATSLPAVLITSGDWTQPYVALTFDVCQDPAYPAGYDAAIVDVLTRYNVRATFFMGGDWMRTHPDETRMLAANPNFELGDHSWSHPDFTQLTTDQMAQEIEQTEAVLFELTGRHSRLFRPPYGTYNDQVLEVVAQEGLYTIEYDAVSGDPDPNFDATTLLGEVRRTVRNGSIVIMHANGRGWHTAEALPSIIEYLQGKGLTLVTVSQLIGLEPMPSQQ